MGLIPNYTSSIIVLDIYLWYHPQYGVSTLIPPPPLPRVSPIVFRLYNPSISEGGGGGVETVTSKIYYVAIFDLTNSPNWLMNVFVGWLQKQKEWYSINMHFIRNIWVTYIFNIYKSNILISEKNTQWAT